MDNITENTVIQVPLYSHQVEVIDEALKKKDNDPHTNGLYLSLPMGYGKTIIGLSLILIKTSLGTPSSLKQKSLIVCSKTLLTPWKNEINKFFQNNVDYEIFHPDYVKNMDEWVPLSSTQIILTTPEIVRKSYSLAKVEEKFISKMSSMLDYKLVRYPFVSFNKGIQILHSIFWKNILIDECQNYCNVSSSRCCALSSLAGEFRWGLSGTILQEINLERILGLFLLINKPYPRNIKECQLFITRRGRGGFRGFNDFCVFRDKLPSRIFLPKLQSKIILFELNEYEILCFSLVRELILAIWNYYLEATEEKDNVKRKKMGGFILSLITYLRQSLINPHIVFEKILSFKENDIINANKIISKTLKDNADLIRNSSSQISTRIKTCLEYLKKHQSNVIIIFGSYSSCLLYLKKIVEDELSEFETFFLSGDVTGKKREQLLTSFRGKTSSAILFTTYMLGSEGINLQNANVVINLDLYWNNGKEEQSLSRMYRTGQKNEVVYQYILLSNTSLENKILEKQKTKINVITEFMVGKISSHDMPKISFSEIVEIIEKEDISKLAKTFKRNNVLSASLPSKKMIKNN